MVDTIGTDLNFNGLIERAYAKYNLKSSPEERRSEEIVFLRRFHESLLEAGCRSVINESGREEISKGALCLYHLLMGYEPIRKEFTSSPIENDNNLRYLKPNSAEKGVCRWSDSRLQMIYEAVLEERRNGIEINYPLLIDLVGKTPQIKEKWGKEINYRMVLVQYGLHGRQVRRKSVGFRPRENLNNIQFPEGVVRYGAVSEKGSPSNWLMD
jgi:hypothetical protein